MEMRSNNSGYGDFTLRSFVAESGKRPSTAVCVGSLKSANPPSPTTNFLAHGMACFASLPRVRILCRGPVPCLSTGY